MKHILQQFLVGALFVVSSGAIANAATLANCSGKLVGGTPVEFRVRETSLPTFVDGVLVNSETNEVVIQLSCKQGGDLIPGTPSAGQLEWSCTEYKHVDDGDISVRLERGGVTGKLTGSILQKQMYPLKPKKIGRLICKN